MTFRFVALSALGLTACLAQNYEIGAAVGAGFAKGVSVTSPAGSATTGFKTGMAVGGVLGHRMYPRLSGEVRYSYLRQDLRLSSGGQEPTFTGEAHALHYDLLFHTRESSNPVQPFVAVGGGFKLYRGTGTEAAYQPLGTFAYFTKTQDWKPMISAGGGVRVKISPNAALRVEFRDFITPFPEKVITPARNASIGGWVHDIVPMVGISYTF